jgi:hypothetical protein
VAVQFNEYAFILVLSVTTLIKSVENAVNFKITLIKPAISALIAKVKQSWSIIGWGTKISNGGLYYLELLQSFGRHVKPLVLSPFAVFRPYQPALGLRGGSFSLCVIHKEGLCPSSGDINKPMMTN